MADEHVADLLRRAAGRLPAQAPVSEIVERAQRSGDRRHHDTMVLATGLCAAVVLAMVAFGIALPRPGAGPDRVADAPDRAGAADGGTGRCPVPLARPTYLPWVAAGEEIPQPTREATGTGVRLRWSTTDDAGTTTVTLRRRPGSVGPDDGPEVPAYVGGVAGRMTADDDGTRTVWNLGGVHCTVLELRITGPAGASLDRPLRTEAVDVAAALETPGGGFVDWPLPDDAPTCPPPPVRPTHVPWLAPGGHVASPEVWKGGPEDDDGNQLIWWSDIETSDDEPYYVALRRLSEPAGTGGGDPTGVVLRGAEGVTGGGPVAGNVWMGWNIGGSSCNLVELELTTSGRMTTPQARREILQIAESFVPYPGATDGDG